MNENYVTVNGMRWGTRAPLVPPQEYEDFADTLVAALEKPKELFRGEVAYAGKAHFTRMAFHLKSPDLNNPREVRWALLLPPRSKETEAIAAALDPLVQHRGGKVIFSEVPLTSVTPDVWIEKFYNQIDEDERPYYVLLAGQPQDVPFRFQYNLDVIAAVGRVCFNTVDEYAAYAKKVVDFETSKARVLRSAVVLATEHDSAMDGGTTYLSRHFMTDPLVEMMRKQNVDVTYLAAEESGREATLENFLKEGAKTNKGFSPALVFTATHGLGIPGTDEDERRRIQGALVCQDYDGQNGVFSADSVPPSQFLYGSVMITFACYGAGTPQRSDFFHWCHDQGLLECCPKTDFIAALPRRLLAHAHGPLAVFAHIDPSWVYSFADPSAPTSKQWGSRMGPFRHAVEELFQGATIAYAANAFNSAYAVASVSLASDEDAYQADKSKAQNPAWKTELVDRWMTRNDMQNFIVLGDPAVRMQIAD